MQITKIKYTKEILDLLNFSESFSQELLQIWQDNNWNGYVYIAYLENRPIGYILYQDTDTIRGFFVTSSERRKGIGEYLLDYVCRDNEDKECIKVNITVGSESLYKKHNFVLLGPRKDFSSLIVAYRGNPSSKELKKMKEKV